MANASSDYKGRCALYALALSSTSSSWLHTPDDNLSSQYPFLNLGVHYLRVFRGGSLVSDVRDALFEKAQLPVPDSPPPFSSTTVRLRGQWAVDVAVHHEVPRSEEMSGEALQPGVLQFGIDASELRETSWRIVTWISISAFLVWIGISSVAEITVRRRTRSTGIYDYPRLEMPDAARRIGSGDLLLCVDELRFEACGLSVEVTPKQARVLEVMIGEPGRAFSDEEFLRLVWEDAPYATSSDVKQQVYLIRRRLREAGLPADEIVCTVPGVGYKLVATPIDAPGDAVSTDKGTVNPS